ncbi:hypothetical protein RB595_004927 [Gaeumannomyces hyphopodioides]
MCNLPYKKYRKPHRALHEEILEGMDQYLELGGLPRKGTRPGRWWSHGSDASNAGSDSYNPPRFVEAIEVDGDVAPWYKRPEYISGEALAPSPSLDIKQTVPHHIVLWLWASSVMQFQHKHMRWDACLMAGVQVVEKLFDSDNEGWDEAELLRGREPWDPRTDSVLRLGDEEHFKAMPYCSCNSAPYFTTKLMGFDVNVAGRTDPVWGLDSFWLGSWTGNILVDLWVDKHSDTGGPLMVNHMLAALESWEGHEAELGYHAYELYRTFRSTHGFYRESPDWGATGEYPLDLAGMFEVVRWRGQVAPQDDRWLAVVEDCMAGGWWRETACGDETTR